MNAHGVSWRFRPYSSTKFDLFRALVDLRTADALVSFGGPGPHDMLLAAARAREIPVFVIWAGSDVTLAVQNPYKMPHAERAELKHLAVAPWLVDELRQIGIQARYVPLIGVIPHQTAEIPVKNFSVLTYLPEPRRDFYGMPHVYEVARRLPHVTFSIIGAGSSDPIAPNNVHFLGWVSNVTQLIDRCVALLRVPDHDGMSLVVLEALARGRYVAWKYSVPGVQLVCGPDDSVRYLSNLYEQQITGKLQANQEGIDFITSRYEERLVSVGVEQLFEATIEAAQKTKCSTRQVAICGLDIFATDVADLNNRMQTGWKAQVLQFGNMYETASSLYRLARSDVWYTVGTPQVARSARVISRILRKPRIMHWVGTDIEVASRKPEVLDGLRGDSTTHLTEVEWEANELRALGIEAAIVPLPPRFSTIGVVPTLPKKFTVLAYLPRSRTFFYGSKELEIVIRALMDRPIRFFIVGGGRIDAPPGTDVQNLGWCYSLERVYAESSVLVRFTPRDGLSLMVLEALAFGRHVLWTKAFPFVRQIHNVETIFSNLEELLNLHQGGTLKPQTDAATFVREQYDRENCVRKIVSVWRGAASRNGRVSNPSIRSER